jgi:hypothetical protein
LTRKKERSPHDVSYLQKGIIMKRHVLLAAALLLLCANAISAAVATVYSIRGTAEVRRGVSDVWKPLLVGDLLRPEDTIRTGESAEVRLQFGPNELFVLNQFSMIDIGDIREITKKDLLLKLSMEQIRSLPNSRHNGASPMVTIMHGRDRSMNETGTNAWQKELSGEIGAMRLEGARALVQQQYYSSAVLTIKSTLRTFGLRDKFSAYLLLASAFEKLGLNQHAIEAYAQCGDCNPTDAQRYEIGQHIKRLKASQTQQ